MLTKKTKSRVNYEYLGEIYRLIEQFDLISRIDLSKISGYSPASITNITKELIKHHFVVEKDVQNSIVRGRPAVGLCLSDHYWRYISVIVTEEALIIQLCNLNGDIIAAYNTHLLPNDLYNLQQFIEFQCSHFYDKYKDTYLNLLSISLCIVGRLDSGGNIQSLGSTQLTMNLNEPLETIFNVPVITTESFQMWSFAEYQLGNAINSKNVIFLQVDSLININVLSKGKIIKNNKQNRMNIDRVMIPVLSELAEIAGRGKNNVDKYCLHNQVTHHAIYNMVDELLPNPLTNDINKINYLCEQADAGNTNAIKIIHHVADCISYVLMNLVNLFSSDKIMVSSTLLSKEPIFLVRLSDKLQENLLLEENEVEIMTAKYHWGDSIIASSAVKQQLYNGGLIKYCIQKETE